VRPGFSPERPDHGVKQLRPDHVSATVEQIDKFSFVIKLKTATTLSLAIPPSLLGRADEVIQ
jgi:hypothetical protein